MKITKHIALAKRTVLATAFLFLSLVSVSQILTSSPYSRYGLGEINLQTCANSAAMGGSFIAYQQDTTAPFFINAANPAGLAGIRMSILEVGGQAQFTKISSATSSTNKKNVNCNYEKENATDCKK